MKYISITFLFLISTVVNGQCKKDTSVQYYDSTYQSFSKNHQVTVEFGTGSEISNNYNYIGYESDALYCIIYGFDKKYEVKLFTNYSSIYNTSCSSISNIFSNGFVKGKDQDGRIWKIKKPSSQYYSNNDNYQRNSRYNKTESRINHKKISSILSSKQVKIDYNRERVVNKMDETIHQLKILENRIELIGNPKKLLNQISEVKRNLKSCVNNADEYFASSNKSTLLILSCLNGQQTNLQIIEDNIKYYNDYRTDKNKSFTINNVSAKNISYCKINKIFNNDNTTVIEFEYTSPYQKDGWINISPDTHIYDATNGVKLKLIGTWNTEISPNVLY